MYPKMKLHANEESSDVHDDEAIDSMADWTTPQRTISQVNRAGKFLKAETGDPSFTELLEAYSALENWRSSHGYPLHAMLMNLRRNSSAVDSNSTVVQRLKRLDSIVRKLRRMPTTKMSQMQDIGGCRSIVASNPKAVELLNKFETSRMKHEHTLTRNYIQNPKDDGYRSIHLVYKYQGEGNRECYNGMRVEVQIRTKSQHIWATAVEAAGIITRQALKSNQGDEDWLRFFALMSSAAALRERQPLVPGTPATKGELADEISYLNQKLNVTHTLAAFRAFDEHVSGNDDGASYFLVHLKIDERMMYIRGFLLNQFTQANSEYTKIERDIKENEKAEQVALVSARNLAEMKRAYPNFHLDTHQFQGLIKQYATD